MITKQQSNSNPTIILMGFFHPIPPAGPSLIFPVHPQPLIQEHLRYYTQLALLKEFKVTKDYLN